MKKLIFGFCTCAAVAMLTMAQSPATIMPSFSQVYATNGTAALPSISFATDPTKGFFSPGANSIGVSVSAGEWERFTAGQIAIFGNTATLALGNSSDVVFTRAAAGEFTLSTVLFAALGTPANGTFCYCSDCTIANPCASGGTGALAKRLAGAWVCN